MTTGEFIKMLQNEDPSGECHLRMPGGIPIFVAAKPGYYDGAYSYKDNEGNYVTTTQGSKVDVYCEDLEDFIVELVDPYEENNWDNIKNKLKFNFGCFGSKAEAEKIEKRLEVAKKYYDETLIWILEMKNKSEEEMISNWMKGWTWFQNKDVDKNEIPNMHVYYTWKIYDENLREMGSNVHMTESVLKSGKWEKFDNGMKEGYYQWVYRG